VPIGHPRGITAMATSNGRPDLDLLRSQTPLHDTADELCAVAKDLMVSPDDIFLGARATEARVKGLSTEGRLANYRIVHFATHGALAGELKVGAEPGLILTPPKEQSDADDGYLSASEVAALKLDADWVILSACNTAAGEAKDAEALSGLARAFFHAGARSLLVSHWAVDSSSTVKLITRSLTPSWIIRQPAMRQWHLYAPPVASCRSRCLTSPMQIEASTRRPRRLSFTHRRRTNSGCHHCRCAELTNVPLIRWH
jgi:CHAT domain-containing protein